MSGPSQRWRNRLIVAAAGSAIAVLGVVAALELRGAPSVDAPDVPGVAGWRRLGEAPLALTEVAAAAFDGRIWVAGGLDANGRAVATVQVYEPAADSWSEGRALPGPVHHASLVADDGGLVLLGGYAGDTFDRPTDEVWRLSAAGARWSPGPALPEPRGAGAAAWDGERIVFAGGVGPEGVAGTVFAGTGDGWQELGRVDTAREHLGAASDGKGATYVLGGRNGITGNLGTVDLVTGGSIEPLGELLTPRGGVAGFWHPGVGACLVGGEEPAGTRSEVECVGPDGSVVALPDLAVARHGLGAAIVDGVVFVVLGGPEPGLHVSGVVEALDLPG